MLYTSERNFGCRFIEVLLFGTRAIILENEKIRVMILVGKGTEIIEFNHKASDTDIIYRSPLGLSCIDKIKYSPKDDQILTAGYTGGWFEAFPNVGKACSFKGANIPEYGEVCYIPWEYTVLKDDSSEVIIKCFVKTTKTPFLLEKIFIIKSLVPTLFLEESILNFGNEDLEFQWGHHPNFGSNIIDESCILEMSSGEVVVDYSSKNSRFSSMEKSTWPYLVDKIGNIVDLRKLMPKNTVINEVIEINNLKEGSASVINMNKGLRIDLAWDLQAFPHNVMWQVCNDDYGYPRYGNTYVLGFLIRNDSTWTLEKSLKAISTPIIKHSERKTAWLSATINGF